MEKLYKKSEIWFAIIFIIIYCVGHSIADQLSINIGIEKSITFLFDIIFSIAIFNFIRKNSLYKYYGICKPERRASEFLFYIPLIILAFHNLFFGFKINMFGFDVICYIGSMMLVGFLEEIIFRGFLFNAMRKDNLKVAVIVSSVTFGLGHLLHLINGSGAELIPTICQALSAIAIGYMFVIIFLKGRSLIPCIIAHSLIDMTSAFANTDVTPNYIVPVAIITVILCLSYSIYLSKKLE